MADTVTIKKITDLPENTDANNADLFMQGVNGTASLRKIKWSTILAKIKSKLLANNLTTTQEGYALDARQGKALSDQINALNTNLGAIESEYFTENDSAIWITPGTYIFMINYSISGTGTISVSGYNFTDSEGIGFAINFTSPSNARGDIVRAINAEKSMQVGIHATGSTTSVLAQITAVRLK